MTRHFSLGLLIVLVEQIYYQQSNIHRMRAADWVGELVSVELVSSVSMQLVPQTELLSFSQRIINPSRLIIYVGEINLLSFNWTHERGCTWTDRQTDREILSTINMP